MLVLVGRKTIAKNQNIKGNWNAFKINMVLHRIQGYRDLAQGSLLALFVMYRVYINRYIINIQTCSED